MAVLKPVNPSIATTSTPSRQAFGRSASQVSNACLERPSTMSSSLEGPVPIRIGVRSMMTVTYLSPLPVCRQTCSSTPMTRTPSKRVGSLIRTLRPSARTAALAVFQATPSALATRVTVRCWQTIATSAQRTERQPGSWLRGLADVLAPDVPAAGAPVAVDRDEQRRGSPPERLVRQRAGDAISRGALAAAPPAPPVGCGDPAGKQRPAGSSCWPVTSRPRSSSRQNVVRSG